MAGHHHACTHLISVMQCCALSLTGVGRIFFGLIIGYRSYPESLLEIMFIQSCSVVKIGEIVPV